MTTTTTIADGRRRSGARPRTAGFTLAEVIVGSGLAAFVLAGMLAAFVFLGRSGANLAGYATMDAQTRRALEDFAQDLRMASGVTWNSTTSITLTVPENYTSNGNLVTYAWDSTAGSATYRAFFRKPGAADSAEPKLRYITGVTGLEFFRYDRLNAATTTDSATKRVRLQLTVASGNRGAPKATDATVSASFVLRNKPTT